MLIFPKPVKPLWIFKTHTDYKTVCCSKWVTSNSNSILPPKSFCFNQQHSLLPTWYPQGLSFWVAVSLVATLVSWIHETPFGFIPANGGAVKPIPLTSSMQKHIDESSRPSKSETILFSLSFEVEITVSPNSSRYVMLF